MANVLFPSIGAQKVSPIWTRDFALADEGALFIATNPTPATAIATTTSVVDAGNSGATSAQTRPVMIVYNSWAASDGNAKSLYPLMLHMVIGQVPTSATAWNVAMWMEPIGASAYTSGGSTIVPVPANRGANGTTKAQVYFGALTAAATTSGANLVARRIIDSAVPVTGDEWVLTFGAPEAVTNVLSAGTTVKRVTFPLPALVIPPSYALKIGMWGTSNAAAPTWEFDFTYAERVSGL